MKGQAVTTKIDPESETWEMLEEWESKYNSRSEAVRAAIRTAVEEEEREEENVQEDDRVGPFASNITRADLFVVAASLLLAEAVGVWPAVAMGALYLVLLFAAYLADRERVEGDGVENAEGGDGSEVAA
jgi:Arc/MetJ-type ribon-helix-helix transcriptional regulator